MIIINKYMQKVGEPENDAGFLKVIVVHVASSTRVAVTVFRLH